MEQRPKRSPIRDSKSYLWLVLVIVSLVVGCVWGGYRQYEAKQRDHRLFMALRLDNPGAVQTALNIGANPNSSETFGQMPTDFLGIVKQLFLDAMHPALSETALSEAAQRGDPRVVHVLLDHGADPKLRNSDGSTPLMVIANVHYYGIFFKAKPELSPQIQIMQMLLDKGADVNAKNREGETALWTSVSYGFNGTTDMTVLRFLLEHGADANVKSPNGETLLQWTVWQAGMGGDKGIVPFVSLLLDHGANANVKDSFGWTPLMRACQWINPAMVKTLLKHGANPNPTIDSMMPLMEAARQGQMGTVKLLLDKGADVNAHSPGNSTALVVATQHDRADIVKLLLEHGANPNYVNNFEECDPALVFAALNNDVSTIRLLLSHGANVNLNGRDYTPLTAAANGCYISSYTKRHNSLWNPGDLPGILPVSPLCGTAITQMLLAAGADANQTDQVGNTALIYAVAGHNTPLVRLLLAHGANPSAHGTNPNLPSSAGETPLSLATQRGYSELVALLRENPHSVQ